MKIMLAVSILIALIVGCSQTPEEKLESLYATTIAQIDKYEFDAANASIEEMGQLDPSSPIILFCRGLILEQQLCYLDAAHEYMFIASLYPEYTPAMKGLNRSFSHLGEYSFVLRATSDLARLVPNDPDVRLMLAEAMIRFGQYQSAEREIASAVKMGASQSIVDLMTARFLHLNYEIDSSRVIRQQVMKDLPETVECFQSAADLYEEVGLIDSSIAFSRRALEAAPKDNNILMNHFYRCVRQSYFYDARLAIAHVEATGGGEIVRAGMLARYYRAAGMYLYANQAATDYRRLTENSLMSTYLDIQIRAEGIDLVSASGDLQIMQGTLSDLDYLPEFRKYVIYSLFAHSPEVLIKLEDLQELSSEYANTIDVKTRNAFFLHKKGYFDDYKEFVTLLEDHHRSQPDWLTGIADVNADNFIRKYTQAERLYTRALEINHWYRPAFDKMLAMYRKLQQYPEAMALYEKYHYFEETYPLVRLNKVLILAENNQLEEALAILENNFMLAEGNLSYIREFMDIASLKGDDEVLGKALDILLTQDSNPEALKLAAVWSCKLGNYQQGLDLCDHVLSIEDDYDSYATKAWALHGLGRKTEAFELFEENQIQDPNNAVTNYYHSYLLASDGIDLDRASNIARKALYNSQFDVEVWMNLCFVYYQAGRYDLCRGEATKASHTYSNRPEPFYWIGMAMVKEGKEEAKENLQKAIMLGLLGDKLETAQGLVEGL